MRYEGFRVRLEPLTAASLRAEMLDGVRLDPSLELIAYLYEPVAGAPVTAQNDPPPPSSLTYIRGTLRAGGLNLFV